MKLLCLTRMLHLNSAFSCLRNQNASSRRVKMTNSRETHTPSYSEPTRRLMLERTASKHAAFFTPFLRGMLCSKIFGNLLEQFEK